MIYDNLNFDIPTNKGYEEIAVFVDLRCAGFLIKIACIGHLHHYNITFHLLLTTDVIRSNILVQANNFIVH